MNESTRTSKLTSLLRKRRPTWEVWKVNDRVAGGRPDVQTTGDRLIVFSEFKMTRGLLDPPHQHLTPLQHRTCERLHNLGKVVRLVGLHPDGTHSVWEYDLDAVPISHSRTAWVDHMEMLCSAD